MTRMKWRQRIAVAVAAALSYGLVATPPAQAAEPAVLDPTACGGQAQNSFSGAPRAWQYDRIKPERAWAVTGPDGKKIDGTGIKVAVLDTGAAVTGSPYFDPAKVKSYNLVGDDADIQEKLGKGAKNFLDCLHGTMVVSLINGQRVDNGSNFSGMAPGATVYAMRVLATSDKQEPQDALIRGVQAAIDLKVNVINVSQAGGDRPELRAVIQRAIAAGITVVAATGNRSGDDKARYPASYPGVIAVGMSTRSDAPRPESGYDPAMEVTVAAPGDEVVGLVPSSVDGNGDGKFSAEEIKQRQGYRIETGTSFATPLVAGLVALMLQKEPGLTPGQIRARLQASADPPMGQIPDKQLGFGIINPVQALTKPMPSTGVFTGQDQTRASAPPLPSPVEPDPFPKVVAVAVGAGSFVLLMLGLVIAEAIPAMRRRRFKPAAPPARPPT